MIIKKTTTKKKKKKNKESFVRPACKQIISENPN